jgi:ring-1,2-phenylacetyl-CoA epoxidase subunit PaaA
MFPVDKGVVQSLWYSAPDVIPELCFALDDIPSDLWNSHEDLDGLANAVEPYLRNHGARKWDFVWSMERHLSRPYGPLAKARTAFMAGIPDMFLQTRTASNVDTSAKAVPVGVLADQVNLNRAVASSDLEIEAAPFEFEAASEMPDDYRQWLEKLFFAHGECMTPYFSDEAKGVKSMFQEVDASLMEQAPDAKSRLRFSNFTNEEYKHTFQFYMLYSEYDPNIPYRIYEHEKEVFRAYMDVKTDGSWIDYAIFNMLADRLGTYQAFEWVQSSYAPLARVSLKVVKDERGHCNMGYLNVRDFIEREGVEGRKHVQRRIHEHFYPFNLAAFGGSDSVNNRMWRKWGLKQHTNDELRAAYDVEMSAVFESLGIDVPDFEESCDHGFEAVAAMKKSAAAASTKNVSAAE